MSELTRHLLQIKTLTNISKTNRLCNKFFNTKSDIDRTAYQ